MRAAPPRVMGRALALLAVGLVAMAGAVLANDARDCVQDKDAELAIRACSELIRGEPGNPVPYNHRGNAHRAKGDYAKAIADHTMAVEIDPRYAVGFSNRCNDYVRTGDADKALADCNKAIELHPKYPVAYLNRGLAHERLGKYDLAIADHSKAIELSPKYARAYNARAWTYYKAKKAAQGLPDVQRALELRPDDPAILDTLGHILEAMGRRKEAIEYYRKALAKDPGLKESIEALKRLKVRP